ncbi:hypothetical protein ATANTOWER_007315 [Ataeniobius toweri]|uniref:Uncharacterized protein n=1 Tax=Ataeniobius toweri TaxID=208326 RepID=A0ABU7C9I0_9TELE|nr:hypothetical protein [Ataeniobius toweri]
MDPGLETHQLHGEEDQWVTGKLVPISSSLRARGRVHPGQVASPSHGMSLDCGRKPEYLVRNHACMERTCKLHAERPPARN